MEKKCLHTSTNSLNNNDPNENVCEDKGEWNAISLSDADIDKIEHSQGSIMPNRYQLSKVRNWFEYIEDYETPANSRFRCKICHKYSEIFYVAKHQRPNLASPVGVLKSTIEENTKIIQDHPTRSKTHIKLLHLIKEQKKCAIEDEISNLLTDKHNADQFSYAVTNRHMRLGKFTSIITTNDA